MSQALVELRSEQLVGGQGRILMFDVCVFIILWFIFVFRGCADILWIPSGCCPVR
jgi:ammonia channel protein AmtB